MNPADNRQP